MYIDNCWGIKVPFYESKIRPTIALPFRFDIYLRRSLSIFFLIGILRFISLFFRLLRSGLIYLLGRESRVPSPNPRPHCPCPYVVPCLPRYFAYRLYPPQVPTYRLQCFHAMGPSGSRSQLLRSRTYFARPCVEGRAELLARSSKSLA